MLPIKVQNKSIYILLWLAVGKPSFSSNYAEEIRPGCRNLQRPLIMVNLSETLLEEGGGVRHNGTMGYLS